MGQIAQQFIVLPAKALPKRLRQRLGHDDGRIHRDDFAVVPDLIAVSFGATEDFIGLYRAFAQIQMVFTERSHRRVFKNGHAHAQQTLAQAQSQFGRMDAGAVLVMQRRHHAGNVDVLLALGGAEHVQLMLGKAVRQFRFMVMLQALDLRLIGGNEQQAAFVQITIYLLLLTHIIHHIDGVDDLALQQLNLRRGNRWVLEQIVDDAGNVGGKPAAIAPRCAIAYVLRFKQRDFGFRLRELQVISQPQA